jgi:hypothetical protein
LATEQKSAWPMLKKYDAKVMAAEQKEAWFIAAGQNDAE